MLRSTRRSSLYLGLFAPGALLFVALSAHSQAPTGTATATSAPAASASAAPALSGSAAAIAQLPQIRGADVPAEPSEAPKPQDWAGAKKVRPRRDIVSPCSFSVLREWLRVECDDRIGAALLAGDPADVKIWAWGHPFGNPEPDKKAERSKTIMTMRLKRGDSKVLQLIKMGDGYDWVFPDEVEKIAVVWREGKEDPVLLIQQSVSGWW